MVGQAASNPITAEPVDGLIAGKYRLQGVLGRGGMGTVYAGRHELTGRRFAIKLLSQQLAGDARAEERFMREAMLASSIQHPSIVEVYDVGRDRGRPYMVMKLIEGETLGTRMKRGRLSPAEALSLLLPVIEGIAAAHARGIVHRDLKPENVLIERKGGVDRAYVLDFGISKLVSNGKAGLTRPGMVIGTPEYMAPEQVVGVPDLDARCDVYALGVLLYEMLTDALPYDSEDLGVLLRRITLGGARSIRAHVPELPLALEAVVSRAMATEREHRYLDAAALREALLLVISSLQSMEPERTAASRTVSIPLAIDAAARSFAPPSWRSRAALLVAGSAAALGLTLMQWPARHAEPTQAAATYRGLDEPAIAPVAPALPKPPLAAVVLNAPAQAIQPSAAMRAIPSGRNEPVDELSLPLPRSARGARVAVRALHREPEQDRAQEPAERSPAQTPAQTSARAAAQTAPPSVSSELLDPFD